MQYVLDVLNRVALNENNLLLLPLDIADDKESGMPSVICRKCCTVVITFDQFKRSVEEGQRKLETIMEKRRIRKEKLRELQEQVSPLNLP